jgi:hypothetical protein
MPPVLTLAAVGSGQLDAVAFDAIHLADMHAVGSDDFRVFFDPNDVDHGVLLEPAGTKRG